MKCQHCEKPATFHITELTEPSGPIIVHLCEEHARVYLSQETQETPSNALAGMLAKQLKLEQTADQLAKLDRKTCPVCGITFAEFRKAGRLGCAYDYVCFQEDLEPLLLNIHGVKVHKGKQPKRKLGSPDRQHKLIQLRREMKEAIAAEQYEKAAELRDQIQTIESGDQSTLNDAALQVEKELPEAADASAQVDNSTTNDDSDESDGDTSSSHD